jgi:hypothetical protein
VSYTQALYRDSFGRMQKATEILTGGYVIFVVLRRGVAFWKGRRFRQCGVAFYSLRNDAVDHSCGEQNEALITEKRKFLNKLVAIGV